MDMTTEKKNVIARRVRYIALPYDKRTELSVKFGCSMPTVWRALRMDTDSALGAEIRRAALAMGGQWATQVKFIES